MIELDGMELPDQYICNIPGCIGCDSRDLESWEAAYCCMRVVL